VDQILINVLNGVSSGLLLFMLSSGLTLIFSMMGVLNFAHASFYMIGAYFAYSLTRVVGFWPALVFAPIGVGLLGAVFETTALRRVHKFGHVAELLITFGLSYVVLELVQIVWGRTPVAFDPPAFLQGPAFTVVQSADGLSLAAGAAQDAVCHAAQCSRFPMTRAFMMFVALAMLVSLWLLLTRTRIGLVIQASLTHPEMAEALGHNVPRVFMLVFGAGCALAGLAGVIGGVTFVTEPAMAAVVGSIIFVVVVVGGMGSLAGAFIASLLIGLLQTLPLTVDASVADAINSLGGHVDAKSTLWPLLRITLAQAAPILPYLLLVLILILRPRGLLGTREG
jgi:branched-chain amino acid transport system permease protein